MKKISGAPHFFCSHAIKTHVSNKYVSHMKIRCVLNRQNLDILPLNYCVQFDFFTRNFFNLPRSK